MSAPLIIRLFLQIMALSRSAPLIQTFSVRYTQFSYSQALDIIDHKYGFSESLVKLFRVYLSNRFQYITFNGFPSNTIVTSGVPQDFIFDPLLSCITFK